MNKNSNTEYSTIFSVSFENAFGDIYEAQITKIIKWSTAPTLSLSDFAIGGLSSPAFVKEGMSITGTLTIGSYHGKLDNIVITGTKGDKIFYSSTIPSPSIDEPDSQASKEVRYELSNLVIGEQVSDLEDGTMEFKITGTNSLGISTTFVQNMGTAKVYRHVPGQINIESASYDGKDEIITYGFKFLNFGIHDSLKKYSEITAKIIADEDLPKTITGVSFEEGLQTKTLEKTLSGQFLKLKIQFEFLIIFATFY